jgi:hypothetical protein
MGRERECLHIITENDMHFLAYVWAARQEEEGNMAYSEVVSLFS